MSNTKLRPVEINKTFNLAIDAYSCIWGGLTLPKLFSTEIDQRLGEYKALVSLQSSVGEDTHVDKRNYFRICMSHESTREVGIIGMAMLVVFSFESLKNHPRFLQVADKSEVKFLRHLRNAAAHGNQFNFYIGKKFLDPGKITWRNKTVEKCLHGKVAFPDFIFHGDIPYLLEDISLVLASIDSENNIY